MKTQLIGYFSDAKEALSDKQLKQNLLKTIH